MSFETKVHSSVCNIAGHFHRVLSFYSWFLYISVNMWKLDISGGGLLEICSNYEYSGSLMKFLRLHEKMGHPSPYRFSFCRLEASFAVVFWSFSCSRVGDNYCACVCLCITVVQFWLTSDVYGVTCVSLYIGINHCIILLLVLTTWRLSVCAVCDWFYSLVWRRIKYLKLPDLCLYLIHFAYTVSQKNKTLAFSRNRDRCKPISKTFTDRFSRKLSVW